jgi:hypothetical protein
MLAEFCQNISRIGKGDLHIILKVLPNETNKKYVGIFL